MKNARENRVLRFDGFAVDLDAAEIRNSEGIIPVEPQVFDLVALFCTNPGRLIGHDEIVEKVWRGRIVSDSAIATRINAARKALGDDGTAQRIIKTVRGRGFRFELAPIAAIGRGGEGREPTTSRGATSPLPHRRQPCVVVLPFENLSGQRDEYFVDGMADEVTSALSRVRDFCVIARQSAFAYKGRLVDARDVNREFGASYVVEGTVRRDGDRLRISVKLVDAETSTQLWSDHYDGVVSDTFQLQDRIAAQVAGTMQPAVRHAELELGRRKPPNSLAAYDCVLRGMAIHKSGHATREEAEEAVVWFDRALELDPNYARALAWRACSAGRLWPPQPTQEHLDRNMDLVSKALSIDPADSEVHRIKGALHTFQRQFDPASYHLRRARELSPNDAHLLVKGGLYLSYLGEHQEGLNDIDLAIRRNPLHPDWYWRERGIVLFGLGAYREALDALQRCQEDRDLDHVYQAACLVALGEESPAREHIEQLRRTRPEVDLQWLRQALLYRCYKDSTDLSRLTAFATTAGLT